MNGIPIDPCGTDTADWVHDRIRAYNAQYITDCGELNFCVRGLDAAPLGGIAASRDLDCVTVDFLYVEPSARGDGLGAALLRRVEEEGRRQGARRVLLNTFSFQAPGFYEKQGYRCFGALEPCFGTHGQYFFCKEL